MNVNRFDGRAVPRVRTSKPLRKSIDLSQQKGSQSFKVRALSERFLRTYSVDQVDGCLHLLCASKKGISSHQLHRMLGVTYKSAWYMTHRIRHTMKQNPFTDKLDGVVEADETYVGGRRHGVSGPIGKLPVMSLLQRGGKVHSFHMLRVTAKNLKSVIRENVSPDSYHDRLSPWLHWPSERVCLT